MMSQTDAKDRQKVPFRKGAIPCPVLNDIKQKRNRNNRQQIRCNAPFKILIIDLNIEAMNRACSSLHNAGGNDEMSKFFSDPKEKGQVVTV